MIHYKSTRGSKQLYSFSEAILKGIADDGGLFVPTRIPKLSIDDLKSLVGKSYQEICFYIINLFETDFSESVLKKIIYKAYSNNFDHPQITPLVHLKDNQYMLELWHGPTLAFKDIALQLKPYFFVEAAKNETDRRKKEEKKPLRYLILVATSGDTGKAALEGYKNKEGITIVVFYPDKMVSNLQERQMVTQEGENVCVYAIYGNFDDIQRIVKEVFNDQVFNKKLLEEKNIVLSSANSINWGRLVPQIVYHVSSYLDLVRGGEIDLGDDIDVAVPTGNFGNILSAYYAKKMGVPIRRLICASNTNNVLTEFLKTGSYDNRKRKLIKTASPSMDILISSNIERLLFELTKDSEKVSYWLLQLKQENFFKVDKETIGLLRGYFYADWVSNDECLSAIKKIYEETRYLMDPHTAVALEVVERYQKKNSPNTPIVICSTAHWAKFPKDVYKALLCIPTENDDKRLKGLDSFTSLVKILDLAPHVTIPPIITNLQTKEIRHKGKCNASKGALEQVILKCVSPSPKKKMLQ